MTKLILFCSGLRIYTLCSIIITSLIGISCTKPINTKQESEATIDFHADHDKDVNAKDDAVKNAKVDEVNDEEMKADVAPSTGGDDTKSKDKTPDKDEKSPIGTTLKDIFKVDQKLDLVIALDANISEDRGQDLVTEQLETFAQAVSSAIDTQIHFFVGGELNLVSLDPKKIAFIDQNVRPNRIIGDLNTLFANGFADRYIDAAGDDLDAPLAFRKDANVEIVIFATDNGTGSGNLAVDFDAQKTLKATVSAAVALADSKASDVCNIEAVGKEYSDLSKKLGGSTLDICTTDFAKIISTLVEDMTKRNLVFRLTKKPLTAEGISVMVNGKPIKPESWIYDRDTNAIRILNPSSVVAGAKLELSYEVPEESKP